MSNDEIEQLVYEVFQIADVSETGDLDPREFESALRMSQLQLTPEEVERFMDQLDTDGDGRISYTE